MMPVQPQTISNARLLQRLLHYSEFSSVFASRKKPKQCDCLTGSDYLPLPSSHPGDPKPHEEHRCFPIQLTGPPFPIGLGSPCPQPTGDAWRRPEASRRERSHMNMLFIIPYPVEKNNTGLFCV